MQRLDQIPITDLKGVAKKVAEKLDKLSILSVQDLLFHLPLRYEDRTRIYPIADLMPGMHGTILAEIQSAKIIYSRKRMLTCDVRDETGRPYLTIF